MKTWQDKPTNGEVESVDFVYRGEPSGYIGEFAVKQGDDAFHLQRVSFRMA